MSGAALDVFITSRLTSMPYEHESANIWIVTQHDGGQELTLRCTSKVFCLRYTADDDGALVKDQFAIGTNNYFFWPEPWFSPVNLPGIFSSFTKS
jgi:hypothetical protein